MQSKLRAAIVGSDATVKNGLEQLIRDTKADEVIGQLIDGVYTNAQAATAYERGVRRQARRAVVDALFALATNEQSTADVRAVADDQLSKLATPMSFTGWTKIRPMAIRERQ